MNNEERRKKQELIAMLEMEITSAHPCIPMIFADGTAVYSAGTRIPGLFPLDWLHEISRISGTVHDTAEFWEHRLFVNLLLLEMLNSEEEGTNYHE